MARPKKQTVDYFPHDCLHKATMFIIEEKYGNTGYAFWFKLLEILGSSEGHFINCNDAHQWLFLTSKTRTTEVICEEIVTLLANLEAIDKELWVTSRIIWSDNFIERIAEAYRNRTSEIPKKPDNLRKKPVSDEGFQPQSDVRNPQTKLNKTKEEKNITPKPPQWGIDSDFEKFWIAFPRKTAKQKALKSWNKIKPQNGTLDAIMSGIENQKKSEQWQRGVIPHPATWLNGRRWEDEIIISQPTKEQPNRFTGLNEKNYREGVNPDGTF